DLCTVVRRVDHSAEFGQRAEGTQHRNRSIKAKTARAHVSPEVGALWHGVLPRLVLGPAVEGRFAPLVRRALLRVGTDDGAPPVIGLDLRGEIAVVIAVLMQGKGKAEAWRDGAILRRPSDAEAGHRDDALRQLQQLGNSPRMIADHADRAATKSG